MRKFYSFYFHPSRLWFLAQEREEKRNYAVKCVKKLLYKDDVPAEGPLGIPPDWTTRKDKDRMETGPRVLETARPPRREDSED